MIGLLGGSFDPVHAAHLAMADAFARALSLDEVRFLPASRPWQKDALAASAQDREAMLAAALAVHRAPYGRYTVDRRELARGGRTYTIDTLIELRETLGPVVPLVFLIGADQLLHLDTWRDWTHLWEHAHLAAVTRPGFDLADIPDDVRRAWFARAGDAAALHAAPAGRSFVVEDLALDVSATDIRALLAAGRDRDPAVVRLVPPPVLDYIRTNHLYRG
jgi:nicotinate-nucleotide adenylyltransferase